MVSGGWVSRWSAPESMATRPVISELTRRGFTVFLVRHGSSPLFKVPDAVDDVRLAVEHIRGKASVYGVDPNRLGLMGRSAGGHLSLAIGLRAEGPGGQPADPDNERTNQVAAIVAYYPPVDLRGWSGPTRCWRVCSVSSVFWWSAGWQENAARGCSRRPSGWRGCRINSPNL